MARSHVIAQERSSRRRDEDELQFAGSRRARATELVEWLTEAVAGRGPA